MSFINCEVEISLSWIENCVLTIAETGANANLLVQIVQLLK